MHLLERTETLRKNDAIICNNNYIKHQIINEFHKIKLIKFHLRLALGLLFFTEGQSNFQILTLCL